MTIRERYAAVIQFFQQQLPAAETELHYQNPFQLLVAVVLSAQCTDKRVNLVTPALFERFPDPESLAASHFDELFPYIRSISYPNNKTKHLLGLASMLMSEYDGKIPMTVEQLVKLPGVGRKTANVITSVLDQQPNMAVDTHVFRVSARIGLTKNATTPLAAEKQLVKHIPPHLVHVAHHWLILHGRYTCTARQPQCAACGLQSLCLFYQKSLQTPFKSTSATKKGKTTATAIHKKP